MENPEALAQARNRVLGRQRLMDLERVAVFLGLDTEEGALVMEAHDVLALLRQAIHGGSLQPPNRHI